MSQITLLELKYTEKGTVTVIQYRHTIAAIPGWLFIKFVMDHLVKIVLPLYMIFQGFNIHLFIQKLKSNSG